MFRRRCPGPSQRESDLSAAAQHYGSRRPTLHERLWALQEHWVHRVWNYIEYLNLDYILKFVMIKNQAEWRLQLLCWASHDIWIDLCRWKNDYFLRFIFFFHNCWFKLLKLIIWTYLSRFSGTWTTCLNSNPQWEVAIWSSLRRWLTRRHSGSPQRSWRSPMPWRGWRPSNTSLRSPFTAESARTSTPCSLSSGG